MAAYPENLLNNTPLHDEADKLYQGGFISKEQLIRINTELPGLHSQRNPMVWVGLFLFGFVLLNACFGFISVFTWQTGLTNYDVWKPLLFLYTVLGFVALEHVITRRRYYHFGIDDAFLLVSILMMLTFVWAVEDFKYGLIYLVAFIAGTFCSYRYIDSLSSIIACTGSTGFIAYTCIHSGEWGKSFLPFVLMANAGGLYFTCLWLKKNKRASLIWRKCLSAVYDYSILLFYLAGNYMVVREGTVQLLGNEIEPGNDIPLAWLFYGFTIIVPLVYIYNGLRKKERMLLQTGIVSLAFGVFSIRYYHQVLPVEWGLIIAGCLVFAIAYFGIIKLKNNTTGITFQPDRFTNENDLLNSEAIVIAESFGVKESKENTNPDFFGGGEFGGGGASEDY